MAFAPLDLLAPVIATRSATQGRSRTASLELRVGRFDALAVNRPGCRLRCTTDFDPHSTSQQRQYLIQDLRLGPLAVIVLTRRVRPYGCKGGKILGQLPPLTARTDPKSPSLEVLDRIYDGSQIGLSRSAPWHRGRKQWFYEFPLRLRQIGLVSLSRSGIFYLGGLIPWHINPPYLVLYPMEEITC